MDKILLIDGHNQLWRANFSFGKEVEHVPCSRADGFCDHTSTKLHCQCGASWNLEKAACFGKLYNIVYGFFKNLRPIVELLSPSKIFFVLEGHPKFRYALYPNYKANRIIKQASKKDDMDKFFEQRNHVVRILKHFPVTTVRAEDYECDDTINTLVHDLQNEDLTVLSSDTDFIQLLQLGFKNVKIYNPIKKSYLQAPDYHYVAAKALRGDKSDNIEGLVGEKKAESLVRDPEKFKAFLEIEENRANFNINKQLIELQNIPMDQLVFDVGEVDWAAVHKEFADMEFNSIINEKSWKKFTETFNCIKF